MSPLLCWQAYSFRLMHVTRLVSRFQSTDDWNNAARAESSRHPAEGMDPHTRAIIRHHAAGRLDQPCPSLRMALFIPGELFKNLSPDLILFSCGHGPVKRNPIHLDEIVLSVAGNIRQSRLWVDLHTLRDLILV